MKTGQQMQPDADPVTVRNRHVFYIPGYDPIHPRRYRELYRKESALQAAVSGYEVALSARAAAAKSSPNALSSWPQYGWDVCARFDEIETKSRFSVLVWSDIVRDSMDASIAGTYVQLVRTAWIYITSGTLRRLMRLRKGPVIAALYPVAMLLFQAALALLVLWSIAAVWQLVVAQFTSSISWLHLVPGWLFGAAAGYGVLRWFKDKDGKFFAYYLMHDYAYSAASKGRNSAELEGRVSAFKSEILAAVSSSEVEEVLIVGHSSGAHIGVSVLADMIREGLPENAPEIGFLSLGQVVPMVSFLPLAQRLRRDLQYLCQRDEIAWIDVSAPGDGCAFALCDPVSVSGVAPSDKRWPLVFSAAFTQTLSPARWAALRWRFFRLHFQYLCAFDQPGDYDYFSITAGPQTLRERYRGRKASSSRIENPVSKYTSVTTP